MSDIPEQPKKPKRDPIRTMVVCLGAFFVFSVASYYLVNLKSEKEKVKITPVANRTHICIYDNRKSRLLTEFLAVGKVMPKDGTIYFEEVETKSMISIAGALIVTTDGAECPVLNGEEYP